MYIITNLNESNRPKPKERIVDMSKKIRDFRNSMTLKLKK